MMKTNARERDGEYEPNNHNPIVKNNP